MRKQKMLVATCAMFLLCGCTGKQASSAESVSADYVDTTEKFTTVMEGLGYTVEEYGDDETTGEWERMCEATNDDGNDVLFFTVPADGDAQGYFDEIVEQFDDVEDSEATVLESSDTERTLYISDYDYYMHTAVKEDTLIFAMTVSEEDMTTVLDGLSW